MFDWGRCGRGALAACLVAGLSACTAEPLDKSLTHGIPAVFATTANRAADAAPATALDRWWTAFGDRDLNALVASAKLDNLDIAAALAQLDAADAQVSIAGAGLLPQVTFTDDNSRFQSPGGSPSSSLSRSLGASYFLDIWGRNRAILDAAAHAKNATAFQVDVVRRAVAASSVDAYLQVLANRERIAVVERNIVNANRLLKVIEDRQAVGTASAFERAQQAVVVENQRAALPGLRQSADLSRVSLAIALGQPLANVHVPTRVLRSLIVPQIGTGVPADLLVRRPDIRAAEATLEAAHADVAAARTALLPSVTLSAGGTLQGNTLAALFSSQAVGWSLAANIVQTVFDGGRTRATIALTQAQRQLLLVQYRQSLFVALLDVEAALIAAKETYGRERAQQRAATLARQAFTLAEERLQQGTIDLPTLLAAQSSLFLAEDALIQTRLARLQAAARLAHALGGGWVPATAKTPVTKSRE